MTIRDRINRQRESRESAEQARQELFAKAEAEARALADAKIAAESQAKAEAEARAVAEEQARLQAIADAKALKEAEEQAKIKARLDARAAIHAAEKAEAEAKALAKAEVKAQKKAEKEARLQAKLKAKAEAKEEYRIKLEAKLQAKAAAKEEANARSIAKAQAKAEAKAQEKADKEARLQAKLEAKAAAKEEYRVKLQAKLEAKAAAKAEALAISQAKHQAKLEAKAAAEAEFQARAQLKAKEVALELKKAEEQAQKQAQAKLQAQKQAKAGTKAKEQDNLRSQAKTKAEALKKSKLEVKAKAKEAARDKELAKVKTETEARNAKAARELAHAQAIAKAEAKEQARAKAEAKAEERAVALANLKVAAKRKAEKIIVIALQAIAKLRHNVRRIYLMLSTVNFRQFGRIAYGTVIIGVVVMMVQVFIDRYPQTSAPETIFEMPIEPELSVIEAPDHVEASVSVQMPSMDDNLIGTVTSSIAVVAPPTAEPLLATEPELKPALETTTEPTVEPVLTLANWQINAVESDIPAGYPRLVIVIDDVGMSVAVSHKLARLQAPLTLAFLPYANRLQFQSSLVAKNGHELLVHMPMAPKSKRVNPGNNALLDDLSKTEFERRLNWNLSRFTGFIGINNHMGSSLTEHSKEMSWVMAELKGRGLVFLDSVTTNQSVAASEAQLAGVPTLSRNVFLDNERDPDAILAQLKLAMLMSKRRGLSIAIGHPYPETLAVLKKWLPKLEQEGIILTPLSAAISEKYIPANRLAATDMTALVSAK